MSKLKKRMIIIITISIIVTISLYGYFQYRKRFPQTEDAYMQAHIIPIAAEVSGKVNQVLVEDNQTVKQNEILFSVAKPRYQHAVEEANAALELAHQHAKVDHDAIAIINAHLKRAQAELVNSEKNYQRIMSLVESGQIAKAKGDEVTAVLEAAKANKAATLKQLSQAQSRLGQQGDGNANVLQARARLDHALLNLKDTEIRAPANGYPTKMKLRSGTMIRAGQPLFYFVEDGCWWVEANFKETQMQYIQPGQTVKIKLDMYPNAVLNGYVDSISNGSGASFSMLPPENATGNWVKVTQRFPVKIMLTEVPKNIDLRVGASSTVTINTQQMTSQRNSLCQAKTITP